MRYTLVLTAAALFAPAALRAADPPITFQTHTLDRVLGEVRTAANFVGGERAIKALNDSIKGGLGEKGFEGIDLTKPVVGYVLLAPKPEDITAVVALPASDEKAFLALCDRVNNVKHKDLGKGLYQLPPLDPRYKARLRFSDGYAYIAYGAEPEPALDPKAIVPVGKLYAPAENAAFAGTLHFDRLTPEVKATLVTVLMDWKKELMAKVDPNAPEQAAIKPLFAELEKLARRYLLLLGGADTAALRVSLDPATSDVVVETTLTPKPKTELAKQIAARQPGKNRFAGLMTPDTVAGFYYSAPLFAEEIRTGYAALTEQQSKDMLPNVPEVAKATVEELFKGHARGLKAGEFDMAVAVRGPDKDGLFRAVAALSFDDPAALEKAFKKFMDTDGPPPGVGTFKWNADKAGTVDIHTYVFNGAGLPPPYKVFGDDNTVAFAGAPKGIYVTMGPDAVGTLKDALKVKPVEAPALEVVVNPAKVAGLVEKGGGNPLDIERGLGRENKLLSATSLRIISGKELTVRYALSLKLLPRAGFEASTTRD
ncbi:hypothetical protein [Frigoriglobus tundricola]|uniref:DUF3352 domain-containing protein n=1 Tax=Frigoriglobus tundricola TaxID=2774151 RepID=A0A6M5YRT4_9BACT|nr:hypothetical protein [Frigoriglobus tundricola]QJW95971.1 hypothetical protein FTUN_3525 [Frigoriglobus tundricola]